MQPDGAPGHRLVTHYAEEGSTDHDATVLLDMIGTRRDLATAGQGIGLPASPRRRDIPR